MGDATAMDFADASFDSVGTFTMLHHVSTFQGQQSLLQEAFRVLKPGGSFFGSDSLSSNDLHHFHEGDDYNPVEPASFLVRLQAVGFTRLTIVVDWDGLASVVLTGTLTRPSASCLRSGGVRAVLTPPS